ncbi:hypothetical protein [Salmonirosea aquatica]|uniref:DUF1080 domain-containing protein n=1 Tax=Salmonirosea aquatica TaxID=2654236 RepID=A0A7C9BFR2_9BACT|nr:hypothetical protein [Cytophagaceae bacterium SJW1-29]
MKFLRYSGLLSLLLGTAQAQTAGNYTPISLNDLSAFESPSSGWKLSSGLMVNPTSGSVNPERSGSGVLIGSAGQTLKTRATMQDLRLRFDFMLSLGAQAQVVLPGGSRVLLAEGSSVNEPGATTSGYAGLFPLQNATKAAGLWQTLELAYDASTATEPGTARLNSVMLNGVIIQQGEYLPLTKPLTQGQPLALEITKGTVAFRNMGYQSLANRKPLSVGNLSYKLFTDAWDTKNPVKVEREVKTAAITQELGNGMREFHLIFEGEMQADEAGEYIFTIAQSGPVAQLTVDGKEVLAVGESTSQDTHTGQVMLDKGKHRFTLRYSRFPWRAPALGLSVSTAGVRPYDLTTLSSLPVPDPKPYISVTPEGRPEMIRSFIHYQDEKGKRTHALSVGSPAGWHYTMDLNRAALLQTWRGQFADVTEMWYERGEPQLLETAGLTVPVSGQSSYAVLSNEATAWPDSSNLNYLGYRLDAQGTPTLRYAFGPATLTDQIAANAAGLTRTIAVAGAAVPNLYALLGTGENITLVEKGLYKIDNRYYVRVDGKAKVMQRTSAGRQELLLPVSGTVSYTMFW